MEKRNKQTGGTRIERDKSEEEERNAEEQKGSQIACILGGMSAYFEFKLFMCTYTLFIRLQYAVHEKTGQEIDY